jgi:hypothetical protein
MSYLTLLVARQGAYWRRPKVEIPEKTESACNCQQNLYRYNKSRPYLSPTITRKLVVPKTLVRPFNGSLVVVMTVGIGCTNNGGGSGEIFHDCKMECSIAFCTIKVSTSMGMVSI